MLIFLGAFLGVMFLVLLFVFIILRVQDKIYKEKNGLSYTERKMLNKKSYEGLKTILENMPSECTTIEEHIENAEQIVSERDTDINYKEILSNNNEE